MAKGSPDNIAIRITAAIQKPTVLGAFDALNELSMLESNGKQPWICALFFTV